ncbi:MAG TPA: hypothetical protein PLA65_11085 [Spirochaetota bacterium]|nr:DUF4118 domain-containing protein [Spirochaetota bacterium]HPG50756.1 hypothetical protein [Spirochaetota bacterium]HPN12599.1 hypothetical protein [Spirochaetota bacterium]
MTTPYYKTPLFMIIVTLALIVSLGIIDYFTGIEFNFFVFYYIPVSIAAWYVGKNWAIASSVLSALTWTGVDILSEHAYDHWSLFAWNGGIRLTSFIILGIALHTIRKLLNMEKELNKNLQTTLDEVKLLKGFLPICASCKNIRNDQGYWEQIEQYISSHSEAEFTHTLCPDCIKKLYPDHDNNTAR